jgi:hypothetical protein
MFDEASNDFVGMVKGVKVNFHHNEINDTVYWYINITWFPLNGE